MLKRNPNYWRRDERGRSLPYLGSVRFDILGNRDIELLRFRRGELHMISGLDAMAFEQLKAERPGVALDAGPSYDNEMLWFNQVAKSPIPAVQEGWFASPVFRRALSGAINRVGYRSISFIAGMPVRPAGPFSEANRMWFNPKVKPHALHAGAIA